MFLSQAREPNADPAEGAELCTKCWHGGVKNWHRDLSCVGKADVVYKDLRNCNNDKLLPDGAPCKNDSAMWNTYNTYAYSYLDPSPSHRTASILTASILTASILTACVKQYGNPLC